MTHSLGDKIWYVIFVLCFIFLVSLMTSAGWFYLIAGIATMKWFTDSKWKF